MLSRNRATTIRRIAMGAVTASAITLAGCQSSGGDTSDSTANDSKDATAAQDVTLFAAASTRVIGEELVEEAKKLDPPVNLTISNAGSTDLVNQIKEGAPADVLLTADTKSMDKAKDNGDVEESKMVAANTLVMVVPADNPANINSIEDLNEDTTLVLCDPSVPCGNLTEQLAAENNLELHPSSLEHSVTDTLGKVTSGQADAAWVYKTDAIAAGDKVEVIEIPNSENFVNDYPAAVLKNATNAEAAQAVLELLHGEAMRSVWENAGFLPAATK
ncbi:molybdate ABC transporter substrate-binding protein [Corynebacterium pseudodiphtheriticum]|uniref:molybdate ABC transporter substrate-binding protein n=1 Tax=Corynebacterium pseudodiphtheriticum TaxID=37637 RepID=UPI002541B0A9|nr:molybdate ABC transporter substrate-binding protein [Corynebacterium pseudodiphtheriticum]MDK4285578.1 molybdate ABC transporter substrate-binding protein [Corynebacterium pseudodiphtheriticum]MDK4314884.1 molybdate ABC transporter substrate-binding protein [Corynebacterium pseudodiphtheriticum]